MKIYYDHQAFVDQEFGGVSRYFAEIIRGIDLLPHFEIELSVWRSNNAHLKDVRTDVLSFFSNIYIPKKNNILQKVSGIYSKRSLSRRGFDLYHPTNYDTLLFDSIKNKPIVATFHDMIHEKLGMSIELYKDSKTSVRKRVIAQRADKIIAVSESTKADIIELLQVPEKKVIVVPHGSSMPILDSSSLGVEGYERPYLLYVGTRKHYKNFFNFLQAAAPLLHLYDVDILCAGGGKFTTQELKKINILNISALVKHIPIDNDNHLAFLYRHAISFIFPSLIEGFGIPILEAFSCGCPCVLSYSSSLPEVAGDAAVYFEPNSIESIRTSIQSVIDSKELRDELRRKGYERVKLFSWKDTVERTVSVYESLI